MAIYYGSCGFAYKDWEESFYPKNTHQRNYLKVYSKYFSAVEIDSSFFHIPSESTLTHWDYETPYDFTFCFKMPRTITHEKRLIGIEDDLKLFLDRLNIISHKLGPILIQLPPKFTKSVNELIFEDFVYLLPSKYNFAIEFRHESWMKDDILDLLEDKKISCVCSENKYMLPHVYKTSSVGYIRFIGSGDFINYNKLQKDNRIETVELWRRVQSVGYEHIFVFFSNNYEGFAPGSLNKLNEIIKGTKISFTKNAQMSLSDF